MQSFEEGGSEKHLRDIAGVLKTSENIDTAYIVKWAAALGLTRIWQAIQERLG